MVKTIFRLVIITPLLLFLCSCGGSESRESVGADTIIAVVDSAAADSVHVEQEYFKFVSSEEAIEHMKRSGHWEEYSKGIIPDVANECLEYATKLINNEFNRFIVVDKGRMEVLLYDKYGRMEKKYGMACAKNFGTKHHRGDSRTPEGFFTAEGIYDSTDWLFTDDDGVTSDKKGQFGPRFIRLKCPNTSQIGIHGTVAPWSIGHRVSHGCIRITNENILELVTLVEVGMPIIVSPGSRDMKVNRSEGYYIPSITTLPGRKRITIPYEEVEINPQKEVVADSVSVPENVERDTIPTVIPKAEESDSI